MLIIDFCDVMFVVLFVLLVVNSIRICVWVGFKLSTYVLSSHKNSNAAEEHKVVEHARCSRQLVSVSQKKNNNSKHQQQPTNKQQANKQQQTNSNKNKQTTTTFGMRVSFAKEERQHHRLHYRQHRIMAVFSLVFLQK